MARMVLRRDLRRREVETEPALDSIPTKAQTPARYILVSHSLGDPRSTLDCFREKSPSAASSRGRSSWDTVVPPERERERERGRGRGPNQAALFRRMRSSLIPASNTKRDR